MGQSFIEIDMGARMRLLAVNRTRIASRAFHRAVGKVRRANTNVVIQIPNIYLAEVGTDATWGQY